MENQKSVLIKYSLEPYGSEGKFTAPLDKKQMDQFCQEKQIGGTIYICHMVPAASTKVEVNWQEAVANVDKMQTQPELKESANGNSPDVVLEDKKSVSNKNSKKLNGSVRNGTAGSTANSTKRGRGRPRKHIPAPKHLNS